ncbi:MAG: hypothetical protein ABIK92_10205 [Pseudomonadota bacterium]
MKIKKYLFILFISFLLIGGCSNGEDKNTAKEHILSDQVRALEKAKNVEQVLKKRSDKQLHDMDEQSE